MHFKGPKHFILNHWCLYIHKIVHKEELLTLRAAIIKCLHFTTAHYPLVKEHNISAAEFELHKKNLEMFQGPRAFMRNNNKKRKHL